jgi:hypothetical protein
VKPQLLGRQTFFFFELRASHLCCSTSHPSYLGGWSQEITWAQDFTTSLENIMRPHLKKIQLWKLTPAVSPLLLLLLLLPLSFVWCWWLNQICTHAEQPLNHWARRRDLCHKANGIFKVGSTININQNNSPSRQPKKETCSTLGTVWLCLLWFWFRPWFD